MNSSVCLCLCACGENFKIKTKQQQKKRLFCKVFNDFQNKQKTNKLNQTIIYKPLTADS